MYADDTVIHTSAKNRKDIEKNLTSDLNLVANWLNKNELVVNMKKGKTECMLFGTSQRTKDLVLNVEHHSHSINFTKTYKYLGVKLDPSLQLTEHISSTYKKVTGRLYLLGRQLTVKAALAIYNSMPIPLFTYCSILTCNTNNTYKEKLRRFGERADKIVFREMTTTPAGLYVDSIDN